MSTKNRDVTLLDDTRKTASMYPYEKLKKKNSQLWERFRIGDDKAYAEIYNLNVDEMVDYGLHFTDSIDTVKDCIQDVFVSIYSNRNGLKPIENIRFYLLISLKNSLFRHFKKSMDYYQIDTIEPVFCMEYSPEEDFIHKEIQMEIKKKVDYLLESLTPRQREVIYYRFSLGLSYDEICELMKMNYQSVRNLLYRSIGKIRDIYPEYSTLKKLFSFFPLLWVMCESGAIGL